MHSLLITKAIYALLIRLRHSNFLIINLSLCKKFVVIRNYMIIQIQGLGVEPTSARGSPGVEVYQNGSRWTGRHSALCRKICSRVECLIMDMLCIRWDIILFIVSLVRGIYIFYRFSYLESHLKLSYMYYIFRGLIYKYSCLWHLCCGCP